MIQKWLATGLIAACSTQAMAQTAPTGFYLGAGAGWWTIDVEDAPFDESALAARFFAGFQLMPNVSLEGAYIYLDETEDDILGTNVTIEGEAWEASVRGSFPVTERIDLYGRIGWNWYEIDADIGGFGEFDDGSDDLVWAVGGELGIAENLSVRGEFSAIEAEDADVSLVTFSLSWLLPGT